MAFWKLSFQKIFSGGSAPPPRTLARGAAPLTPAGGHPGPPGCNPFPETCVRACLVHDCTKDMPLRIFFTLGSASATLPAACHVPANDVDCNYIVQCHDNVLSTSYVPDDVVGYRFLCTHHGAVKWYFTGSWCTLHNAVNISAAAGSEQRKGWIRVRVSTMNVLFTSCSRLAWPNIKFFVTKSTL